MTDTTKDVQKFDLVVIGGGSGGLTAAEFGVALGASVALVEAEDRLGGECLHAGCVPSKAFIHAARRYQTVRDHLDPWDDLRRESFNQAMSAVKASINHVETDHDNHEYYEKLGVTVLTGRARFIAKDTISIGDDRHLKGKRFIVATGSAPLIPDIDGLADIPYLTNESFFDLAELPASLLVIGGGPIGCELGQALAMFGTKVTIISNGDRLLPHDEPEAAEALKASFAAMDDMDMIFDAKVRSVTDQDGVTVTYEADGETRTVSAAKLLVATGRAANTDLGLEEAGIAYTDRSISTSSSLQTTNSHVYAIGDVMGGPNFTHVAVDQAVVATQNALLGRRRDKRTMEELTWATFTTPEIAHLGTDQAALEKAGADFESHLLDFKAIDKAAADQESGLIKVLVDKKGLILGATVIGGPAAELLAILALAKHEGMKFTDIGGTLQAYPTYAFGLKMFANAQSLKDFESGYLKKFATLLRKLTLR